MTRITITLSQPDEAENITSFLKQHKAVSAIEIQEDDSENEEVLHAKKRLSEFLHSKNQGKLWSTVKKELKEKYGY